MSKPYQRPIGVFDSGIGGLTVARRIHELLPKENILFLADQANVPYGEKTPEQLAKITEAAIPTLIAEGAKVIVIACNTASVSSIEQLRAKYPDTPFVAVVPMIKPAAAQTATGTIAVFATEITLNSELYQDLKTKYARDVKVVDIACPEWVRMVEAGSFEQEKLQGPVSEALRLGADQLVLGCTHFPFLTEELTALIRGRAKLLESGPAIARQVQRILRENDSFEEGEGRITYLTSADNALPDKIASQLTGWNVHFQTVGH